MQNSHLLPLLTQLGGSRRYNGTAVKSRRIQRGWYRNLSEKMRGIFKKENTAASKTRQTEEGKLSMGKYIRRFTLRSIFNKRKFGFLENSTCPKALFPAFIT